MEERMVVEDVQDNASWDIKKAEACYRIPYWGAGYYFVNEKGHMAVCPVWNEEVAIDLVDVARQIRAQGLQFPVLVRFQDLLRTRVIQLNQAFQEAIQHFGYQNKYVGVYPIKVNQLHEVVDEILEAGAPYRVGLECGSRAELVATLPHLVEDDILLICNGYKDEEMMRLMLIGQVLGKQVLPVIEKYREFTLLTTLADAMEAPFYFGVRVQLSTNGSGKWAESGGDTSKFGITVAELLTLVQTLNRRGNLEAFKLLHFHLGSQIANIQTIRQAVREVARVYACLRKEGVPITYLDVGGGLGVNYEGGDRIAPEGLNYTLQEYVNAIVEIVKEVCDAEQVPHPILVSESGRALTAYHSVLLVDVLGVHQREQMPDISDVEPHEVLDELVALHEGLSEGEMSLAKMLEAFHEITEKREQAHMLFALGYFSLAQKARADQLYWQACRQIQQQIRRIPGADLPAEFRELEQRMADQYLCNFSVFQSMLDYWAIDQRFPIVPIQRLDEYPDRQGILVDLTCDSDGKVNHFVASNPEKRVLELHSLREGEPYILGIFLLGAYQDIMGDMHNLFGRVTEVHVYVDEEEPGHFYVEKILPGATVEEILALVQYFPNDLERRMHELIQGEVRRGRIRPKMGVEYLKYYKQAFKSYTYIYPQGS